ncbi:hypothetical protein KEM54_004706 [Ascosphaera aggregata]|nr:hypothetical protein KEM54_004706 [Ascosphaera aggregata]
MSTTDRPQGSEASSPWAATPGGYPLEMDTRLGTPSPFTYNSPVSLYWNFHPDALEHISMPVGSAGVYPNQQYHGIVGPHAMNPAVPFAPVAVYTPPEQGKRNSHGTSAPRRTLTNDDRRRMCLYHMEHPRVKQAEIGKMFGVERSTVSKVLQKKDYFLSLGEEAISPARRSGRKNPDVEKTLANYIRKKEHQNLTDEEILKTAISFSHSSHDPEIRSKMSDLNWVSQFRQKVLKKSGVTRGLSVESGSSASAPTSDVASSGKAPDVSPRTQELKQEELQSSPLTNLSGFIPSTDEIFPSMTSKSASFPTSSAQESRCPVDPVLFTIGSLHRDRTPSLTTMSTDSSLFEQPIDESMGDQYVSPRDLFRPPLNGATWDQQDQLMPEPAAKRLCGDAVSDRLISVPTELECMLLEKNMPSINLDEITSLSATPLFAGARLGVQGNDLKRRRE